MDAELACKIIVLAGSSCYNKTPWVGVATTTYVYSAQFWKVESLRSRSQQICKRLLFHWILTWWREEALVSLSLLLRELTPSQGSHPQDVTF